MKYEIRIEFESDYELEAVQLDDLLGFLSLQIEEPQSWTGEPENWTSKNIMINLLEKSKDVSVHRRVMQ